MVDSTLQNCTALYFISDTSLAIQHCRAPVMYGPDSSECVSVLIACKSKWRLRSDTTKRCPRSNIPKEIMAVGKK